MDYSLLEKAKERLEREKGGVVVDRAAAVRFALVFPNTYSVGMASLGYQLVYQMINALPNASCERAFIPDAEDINEYRRTRTPLFTLESQFSISEFDVVGFSISFEMDYLNILDALQLANIPLLREDRDERYPLIIAGGPCATFNPEPLADFIDAFVIGDAEAVLAELADVLEAKREESRDSLLAALAAVPGVYVPSFYVPEYDNSGRLVDVKALPPAPEKVRRAVVTDLSSFPSASVITTPEAGFGEIELIEAARGCGRKCRFCVAGHITRPPRLRDVRPSPEMKRLGLVGAAVFDRPDAVEMCRKITEAGGEFTVSSVRLETVTPEIAKMMAAGGQKTLTIAPEAGSCRLRRVINKCSTDEQIFSAVRAAVEAGITRVKLYFMIGLPTETCSDIDAIIELMAKLAGEFTQVSFQVSASSFVPKPWTPFQWCQMEREGLLKKRFARLNNSLSAIRGVKFSGESPRLALIQGYLARGDRRVSRLLIAALANGGDYPAAVRETGFDFRFYIYRDRDKDEVFPWDHVNAGVNREYLWNEYRKSLSEDTAMPCVVGKCRICGACEVMDANS